MHPELKNILMELRAGLANVLGERLESVYLYGSQARGEAQPDSDVDILIVLNGEFRDLEVLDQIAPVVCNLSLHHDIVISPAFVTKDQFDEWNTPFIQNVKREAILV